jgi:membrane protein implicated in regulation of membrane protease activity
VVAFLTQTITWWYWIILGILLIILEMGTGTFIVLGFGIAAVLVGFLDLLFTPNFVIQITVWILLSVVIITLLFKYFKSQPSVSSTGQSDHGLDTLGTVTETIEKHGRGKVRFDSPVLGNTLWHATSREHLDAGQRVSIEEVNGQLIKVVAIHS